MPGNYTATNTPRSAYALAQRRAAAQAMSEPGAPGYFPVLGIISSLVGMVIALGTIPSNPTKPGALIVPGLCMAIGLVVAPVTAGLLNPRNFLRTENVVGACPVYWLLLELMQGNANMIGVSDGAVQQGFLYVGLFGTFFWMGAALKGFRLPKTAATACNLTIPAGLLFPITMVLFCLAMLTYAIPCKFNLGVMYRGLFASRFGAPWSAGGLGSWGAFLDHFAYFGYLLPTLATMQGRRLGWMRAETVIALLAAAIDLAFIAQGGGRRIVGVCVGSALLFWLHDQPEVKWSRVLPVILFCGLLLFGLQTMLHLRDAGMIEGQQAIRYATLELQGKGTATGGIAIRVDDNFKSMCQVMDAIPKIFPYSYHEYIFFVLMRPIPRALWKDKPVMGGFDLGAYAGEGASLSNTILGELHQSLGLFAIIVGSLLYGMASKMSDPMFKGRRNSVAPMMHSYITMWLFVGFRSMLEVVLFSYPLLVWMLAVRFFKRRIKESVALTARA